MTITKHTMPNLLFFQDRYIEICQFIDIVNIFIILHINKDPRNIFLYLQ